MNMNRRQKTILIVWAAVVVAEFFYPPFQDTTGQIFYGWTHSGVHTASIHVPLLCAQWFVTSVVAAVCYVLFGDEEKAEPRAR
jgi:hypothetical protein